MSDRDVDDDEQQEQQSYLNCSKLPIARGDVGNQHYDVLASMNYQPPNVAIAEVVIALSFIGAN
jgi:hypothetical protein